MKLVMIVFIFFMCCWSTKVTYDGLFMTEVHPCRVKRCTKSVSVSHGPTHSHRCINFIEEDTMCEVTVPRR